MVKVDHLDPNELSRAVIAWTGYQSASFPKREESAVAEVFPLAHVARLMPIITLLEADFYLSKAHLTAANLGEMGDVAAKEFKNLYPELPTEIAEAFAWCYTFDYK